MKGASKKLAAAIILIIATAIGLAAATMNSKGSGKTITVCTAGSIALPVKSLAEEYQRQHGVTVHVRVGGSLDLVRGVSELGLDCDVVVVADYRLIPEYLYPAGKADWYAVFASNEMVIAWAGSKPGAVDYRSILEEVAEGEATLGISDPNRDPCGYRAVGVIGLIALHDNDTSLLERIFAKGIPGAWYKLEKGRLDIYIPQSYSPRNPLVVRPRSIELIALLEEDSVDYAVLYKNEAVQHHLNYTSLPEWASLANNSLDPYYSRVVVHVLYNAEEGGKAIPMHTIAYAITTVKNATPEAVSLARYMLDRAGELSKYGFNPLPRPTYNGAPPWSG